MKIAWVEVLNFGKYNKPRKGTKSTPWYRMQNDFVRNQEFFDLTNPQRLLWPLILGFCSDRMKPYAPISVSFAALATKAESPDEIIEGLRVFAAKGMIKLHDEDPKLPSIVPGDDGEDANENAAGDEIISDNSSESAADTQPTGSESSADNPHDNSTPTADAQPIRSEDDANTQQVRSEHAAETLPNGTERNGTEVTITPPFSPFGAEAAQNSKTGPPKLPSKRKLKALADSATVDVVNALFDGVWEDGAREKLSPFAWRLVELGRGHWDRLRRGLERAIREENEEPFLWRLKGDLVAKAEQAWLDTGGQTESSARDPPENAVQYEQDAEPMEDAHE